MIRILSRRVGTGLARQPRRLLKNHPLGNGLLVYQSNLALHSSTLGGFSTAQFVGSIFPNLSCEATSKFFTLGSAK